MQFSKYAALSMIALALSPVVVHAQVAQEPGYVLDYRLDIRSIAPAAQAFNNTGVPYTTDNSGSFAIGSFNRVAYELTLSGSTNANSPNGNVWVSFDTPSTIASKLGVPNTGSGEFYKQFVTNMNVIATGGGVTSATGLSNGNIQFWPSNYGPNGATGKFDWNNSGGDPGGGYGAMQISQITNGTGSTGNMFISFDRFGSYGGPFDLGIGNNPAGDPNYTFRQNSNDYSSAVLTVWVVPEPSSIILLALGAIGLLVAARRRGRA